VTVLQTALVHCAPAAHDPIMITTPHPTGVAEAQAPSGRDVILGGDTVSLTADRPQASIWTRARA